LLTALCVAHIAFPTHRRVLPWIVLGGRGRHNDRCHDEPVSARLWPVVSTAVIVTAFIFW